MFKRRWHLHSIILIKRSVIERIVVNKCLFCLHDLHKLHEKKKEDGNLVHKSKTESPTAQMANDNNTNHIYKQSRRDNNKIQSKFKCMHTIRILLIDFFFVEK